MTLVVQIIAHTPPAVFVLLAYLVVQGLRSLRPRRQAIWSLLAVPACFSLSGFLAILHQPLSLTLASVWLVGFLTLGPVGLRTGPRLLKVDRARRRVLRAGTPVPLICNLIVFGLQYGLAVAQARHLGEQASLTAAASCVSGASLGYFAGWTIVLRRHYIGGSMVVQG